MITKDNFKATAKKYLPFFIFFISFFVYLVTLCPSVYWRDSAEFIDAAFTLGIPHPSGFPTYMPLANLLTYLPFGSVAFKVNLFSALMGGLTSVLLFFLTVELISALAGRRDGWTLVFSGLTAMAFAFSFSLWESSITAEVYGGMGAAAAGIMIFAIRWAETKDVRFLLAGAFLFGLSSGIHATVALFLPALLILVATNFKGALKAKDLIMAVFFFLLGFSVYIYLPIRSAADPTMDWGNPETLKQFISHITDKKDSEYHFAISRGVFFKNVWLFLKITKNELTILWPLSAILGLFFAIRKNWRIALFLLLFFLGHVSFFIWYWDSGTIYVASFLVVMALGGVGIYYFIGLFEKTKIPKISLQRMAAIICASFVLFTFIKDYGRLDKSNYYAVEDLAAADFMRFDHDSMVLTSLYWPFFYYFQDVERRREDINVISLSDIFQPKYFNTITSERFPGIEIPEKGYDSKTWAPFLKELLYLNYEKREIYFGPDKRIVEKLSSQLLPEIFFYRLVSLDDVKKAGPEYYAEYLDRLYRFISSELATRRGEFFADIQYKAYYEINFSVLSLYLTENSLWEIERSVIKVAEIILGPVSRLRLDMVNSLTQLGEYEEAEELFLWLISRYPDEVWLHINFGHNLMAQKMYGQAVSEFEEALSIGGADAEAHLGIGISMFRLERYPEALKALTKAKKEITKNTAEEDISDILNLLEEVKDHI